MLMFKFFVSLLLYVFVSSSSGGEEEPDMVHRRRVCQGLRSKYKVKPGTSWGDMDKVKQDLWLSHQCDYFFCKANERAGKGIYKCEPLATNNNQVAAEAAPSG